MAPDTYSLPPTPHAPNNTLPVLHYRNVLPRPLTEDSVTELLTSNKWEKRVCHLLDDPKQQDPDQEQGTWGAISTRHFHPNSHECYGTYDCVDHTR